MSVITNRLREIFKGTSGTYLNEYGEEVYGKLPRQKPESPFKVLSRPTLSNYLYYVVGFLAWSMDGYDFNSVSLSISKLAKYYGQERQSVSTSITLTLLFRPIGAIVFGLAGDLYGRKWPMIANLIMLVVVDIATANARTFTEFLIVRSIFGIAMGGIWGNAVSMSLENLPTETRGFFSGLLQQGYAVGFLMSAVVNIGVVPHTSLDFKVLFYVGACISTAIAVVRCFFPESKQFVEQKQRVQELAKQNPEMAAAMQVSGKAKVSAFWKDTKGILKQYWRKCIYCCTLMAIFASMSHASQDLYPTFMQQTKGFTADQATLATIVGMSGAVVGGTVVGYYSQYFGRRAAIMVAALIGACVIPLWVLPTSWGALAAGAFLVQFCVQGAWGVIPVHLNELSPPQFRASFPGITYQLGNGLAAPMAQSVSVISEHVHEWVRNKNTGKLEQRPDYAKTQAVVLALIFCTCCVVTACGSEAKGTHFEKAGVAGAPQDENGSEMHHTRGEVIDIEGKIGATKAEDASRQSGHRGSRGLKAEEILTIEEMVKTSRRG